MTLDLNPDLKLEKSLAAWGSDDFAATLKAELEAIPPVALGLQRIANWAVQNDRPVKASVLEYAADDHALHARVGLFFTETIAGCACGDAPMERPAYAEVELVIARTDGETSVSLRE